VKSLVNRRLFVAGQSRIEKCSIDTNLLQRCNLVLHQCYQWRYNQRQPITQQCRYLVANGLSAAGWLQHK